jgi:hypothetical protein
MSASTAGVEDNIPELIRLRFLRFETLDGEFFNPSSPDKSWRHILAAVLKESLTADAMRTSPWSAMTASPPAPSAPLHNILYGAGTGR